MKKLNLFFVIFSFLGGSCHPDPQKATITDDTVIDVSKDYPKKSIKFQDIADVEYVPLETNDSVLIDRYFKISHISDNNIVVANRRQGDIFIFGRNGKIKYRFNHRGPGPEEYSSALCVVFDEKNKEVFVYTQRVTSFFLVYSEDGKYKRTIKGPFSPYGQIVIKQFDDDYLLVYEEVPVEGISSPKPYTFISKKDGTEISLDITLPQRYPYREITIMYREPEGRGIGVTSLPSSFVYHNNWHDDQNFIISDISCDTVFQLRRDKSLTPLLRRTPSVHQTNPKVFLASLLKTEKYMLLYRMKMMPEGGDPQSYAPVTLMYDFSTKEIHEVGRNDSFFVNDDLLRGNDFLFRLDTEATVPKNTLVFWEGAGYLCDIQNYTQGKLKETVSTLDREDNPVLMIATFR